MKFLESLSPEERERAAGFMRTPDGFAWVVSQGKQERPAHIRLLGEKLAAAVHGSGRRKILITMPPRHGKSQLASWWFPVWFLWLFPEKKVILSSYEAEFASSWGRMVRNSMSEMGHMLDFSLSEDSAAAYRWETSRGGGMITAGVGGAITGRGGHLCVCDDPVKNSEEANSEVYRQKTHDWWRTTFVTRLEPGGVLVLIQCMIGSTPVLMADGTEKRLRDIAVGDAVASFSHGRLIPAKVRNWTSQGLDYCFTIKTTSGRVATANERHPFLVKKNGRLLWVRLRALRVGDEIILATSRGVLGKASPVQSSGATERRERRDFATTTTTRRDGPQEFALRPSTRSLGETPTSSTDTESVSPSTTRCLSSRTESAPSAKNLQAKTSALIGAESSALIIATKQEKSEGCSATIATSRWDTEKRNESCSPPLSMYETTVDVISEIVPAGREEVFDIEVEGAENFIANGLVTHNTRWHEDDLAGRVLAHEKDEWEHIDFPAIAEDADVLGRKQGEALWPARYDVAALRQIQKSIGSYAFAALYQQNPVPAEGGIFKSSWFKRRYVWLDDSKLQMGSSYFDVADMRIFSTVDLAASVKTTADFTVISTWGVIDGRTPLVFLLDLDRGRYEAPEIERRIASNVRRWGVDFVAVEKVGFQLAMIQTLFAAGLPVRELTPDKDKVSRAFAITPLCEQGCVILPEESPWIAEFEHELYSFPNGKHDDMVDTFSYIHRFILFGETGIPGDVVADKTREKEIDAAIVKPGITSVDSGLQDYLDSFGLQ